MSVDEIIENINELSNAKYLKKDTKTLIVNNLEIVKGHVDDKEEKCIDTLIKIVSKPEYKAEDRKRFKQLGPSVINIIKKYEEEYNEESNEDNIEENLTIDEIEARLDEKIPEYNSFNDNHPMRGITWEKSSRRYKIQWNNIKSHAKNLDDACDKIIQKSGYDKSEIIGNNNPKNYFLYRNHYFICYWKNNDPYFDIQHIISVLNLKKSSWNDKYNEFYDNISYHIWHKNEYGGYILRELIDDKTTYQLILSSNSTLSKSFKKDVSIILADLRKQGQLNITNKKISLKKKTYKGMNELDNEIIDNVSFPIYSYKNPIHVQFIRHLIKLGSNITLTKFANKHVLYAFIIPTKTKHRDIIIKFGYSEDIFDRIETLQSEYKSKVYLVKIKIISGQKDEEKFHYMVKKKYSSLIESYSIQDKKKIELYKFSPILLKEFDDYLDKNDAKDIISEYIDFELNIRNNLIDHESYDYLMTKERNHHEKIIKQYDDSIRKTDFEISKLKYRYIDKEIQLVKAQSELASITKFDIKRENTQTYLSKCLQNTNNKTKLIKPKAKFIEEESSQQSSEQSSEQSSQELLSTKKKITTKKVKCKNNKKTTILKI